MNTKIKNSIEELARATPDVEICGFIYHDVSNISIYPCVNIAVNPAMEFEISSVDYLDCIKKGKILAIYHSHTAASPFGAGFTEADIDMAEEMEIPLRVYSINDNEWEEYIPENYKIPLEGQPFLWGEKDCYGLVRTFLRQEYKIYLSDYARDDTFQTSDNNIILENIEREGYYSVGSTALLKKHDILLFNSGRVNIQHMAVYIGNSRILHHPLHMLSNIEMLNQKWYNRLRHVLRYKES